MTSAAISQRGTTVLLLLVAVTGVVLRLCAAAVGHNFDVESYRVVADIMAAGGNVYQATTRYNYGPVWFHVLHGLDLLGGAGPDPLLSLRWKVAGFLTLVDLGLLWFLFRRYSLLVGALFFLNPVSILITGYHSQFDNLAVLLGLLAVADYDSSKGPAHRWIRLVALGLSLCTKHILFMFPLWLAFRERTWAGRAVALLVPVLVFLLAFVPYLPAGAAGILVNVFLYRSFSNAPLWNTFVPNPVLALVPPIVLFLGALAALGWWARHKSPLDSVHYYCIGLVAFASAIANQYFAIPVAGMAVLWNWVFGIYSVVGGAFLSVHSDGMHLDWVKQALDWHGQHGYRLLVSLLAAGLLINMLRPWLASRAAQPGEAGREPVRANQASQRSGNAAL